jgi:hypothetical protein
VTGKEVPEMDRRSITTLGLLTILAAGAVASTPDRPTGWEPGSPYAELFDPGTLEKVSGSVEQIQRLSPMDGMSLGVLLVLRTKHGPTTVHLGPSWFVDSQEVHVGLGDRVSLRGSKVTLEGAEVVLATEVRRGRDTLKLREEDGLPLWVAQEAR